MNEDDIQLLRSYAEHGSDRAFTELVQRHLNLVYSAALRQVGGDSHRAQDAAQMVFFDLARKARFLSSHSSLSGWLYTSTRFAATKLIRNERRREARERSVCVMNELNSASAEDVRWSQLRPVLDEAMHALNGRDREAIVLRFFEKETFSDLGNRLGLGENAARMTVERALDKLRRVLVRRGLTSTAEALALLLTEQAASAAVPAGLVVEISGSALAGAALTSTSGVGTSAMNILNIMSTKNILGAAVALGVAGILGMGGLGTAFYEFRKAGHVRDSLAAAQREYEIGQANLRELERRAKLADGRVMEIQRGLDQIHGAAPANPGDTNGTAGSPKPGRDPRADGKNFVATFPQARALLMGITKVMVTGEYAPFYRSAGLTPGQISEFEDQTSAFRVNSGFANSQGFNPSLWQLPDDQLSQILGDQGFVQFQEYSRGMDAAYGFSLVVATEAGYSEAVSADQTDQLAQIVTNNSSSYQNGGKLDLSAVDWNAVAAQAESVLSPAQWQAAKGVFASQQLAQAITQASNPSIAGSDSPPPAK